MGGVAQQTIETGYQRGHWVTGPAISQEMTEMTFEMDPRND